MSSAKRDPNYGKGEHTIDFADWQEPERCAEALRSVLRSPTYQPPVLPAVALELMALSSDPEVPFSKVRALIQSEPMLAAKVLRTAQSAFYSRGAAITSLDDAMSRLGLRTLTELFLQAVATTKVFRAAGYEAPMEALRTHSVVCANTSRIICRRTALPDEYAFMCGLLHDVGFAAGLLILADVPRGEERPAYEQVAPALVQVHSEMSLTLAKAWELPSDVQLVLGHHHRFHVGGRPHPLAAAVCLADWIAAEVGAGAGQEASRQDAMTAIKHFDLPKTEVESLLLAAENFVGSA